MGLISNNVNINVIVYSLCLLAPSSPVHAARESIYCYVMMLFFLGGGLTSNKPHLTTTFISVIIRLVYFKSRKHVWNSCT